MARQRGAEQGGAPFRNALARRAAARSPARRRAWAPRFFAIDQSPTMLELLGKRAEREGLSVQTRVMDGHALALNDDGFDIAGSQFGVMLFPDMPRGIREMARVVKPGGRVLVIAYGNPHQIDFLGFLVEAVRSVRPDFDRPPVDPPPLPFQLSDPERLRRELAAAGLHEISVETIIESTDFKMGEELWD
ncbi:methyltransferase domain-containing protein [Mesorhizobium sp. M1403]|uniref:class I SAM-dependent methyltransferase n=1 Tax=unclassified Mesorhizobium TaxID=325217 RepID=UPI003337B4BA